MVDHRATVRAILAGDREQFRTLIGEFQRLVSHIVFRMIPNADDRQDVCQEVFLKVYQNLAGFRFDCKLSTWVGQIAYNTCLTARGKKQSVLEHTLSDGALDIEREWSASDSSRPDMMCESVNTSDIIRREIDSLHPIPGTILVLFHLENLSLQQIAEIFGMPEGTVKSHLFRARRQLKERLAARYQWEQI